MSKIKNAFVACKRLQSPATGEPFKDDEGAFYLVDHDHPCLANKEFTSPNDVATCIADYNSLNTLQPFTGEYILLNVITVS